MRDILYGQPLTWKGSNELYKLIWSFLTQMDRRLAEMTQ